MAASPTTIGRYIVQRPLGQGAMGVVYLAEDPLLKRRLAIKVVRATGEERDLALERFRQEAEISARLNHPNVVTIFDVGEEPGLGPFLAMEYVQGQSLGRHIHNGSLDAEAAFSVLIQTMRGLRVAHRNAIVHRDVKPDNILVSEDGRVKLMDFGIAKTMAPSLTPTNEFLGSPAYSAPELLRGGEPTPNSDRFAFAVTAYELFTGQLPHPGNSVRAVIAHVLQEAPVIPDGMSGSVANVFRKALAMDPDDRYETLAEFVMALVNVYPIDESARMRIEELFRHDDHPGDIVPMRRVRRLAGESPSGIGGAGTGVGNRPADARATGARPLLPAPPPMKIELEKSAPVNPRGTQSWDTQQNPRGTQGWDRHRHGSAKMQLEPKTLVKWIILVFIGGNIFWWLYDAFKHH